MFLSVQLEVILSRPKWVATRPCLAFQADGVRKVTHGVRKVPDGVGKVSDGVGKVSDDVGKLSD